MNPAAAGSRVTPAADRIYRELRRCIIFTELRQGEGIDVGDAAAEFSTSRTPVCEATGPMATRLATTHATPAEVSRNERLHSITEHTLEDLERIFRLCGRQPLESGPPLHDHRRLLAAIRAGDADEAAQIELAHIRRGRGVTMNLAIDSGVFFAPDLSR